MDVKRAESFVFYLQRDDEATSSALFSEAAGFRPIECEQEVARACRMVIYYPPFSDNRTGILGTLYCTTLRLIFVPATGSDSDEAEFRTSRVFKSFKYETSLLNVCQVQYAPTSDSKKLKPLTTFLQYLDQATLVKIYCKDFRIFTFDFKSSEGHRALLNAMLRYAFPQKLNHIVGVYRQFSLPRNHQTPALPNDDAPSFDLRQHWEAELRRTRAVGFAWRVTHVNVGRRYVEGYPDYFVVPTLWLDNLISVSCSNWTNRRIPVWCWSSSNGSALLRCSTFNTTSEVTDRQWQEVENAIAEAHPRKRPPALVESDASCQEVATAFEALRKLCSTDIGSVFWQADTRWLTEIEATGWPVLITKCLSMTSHVVTLLHEAKQSVVFREPGNGDLACVVSSLAQLCLDPYFRTVAGFAVLVQKEWIALSHPFGVRLFGLAWENRSDEGMAPVFLLFLDCVYQLSLQYPSAFAFSGQYLIALWDLALTGLTRTFLFNSLREAAHYGGDTMRSAWSLDWHFVPAYRDLFSNPLYSFSRGLEQLAEKETIHRHEKHSLASPTTVRLRRVENGSWNQRAEQRERKSTAHSDPAILSPNSSIAAYRFWDDCYFRWSAPAQTLRGGSIQAELELFSIVSDISEQLKELRYLRDQHDSERAKFNQQLRHFRVHPLNLTQATVERMTSAFPFGWDTTPIPDYLYILPLRNEQQRQRLSTRSDLELASLSLSPQTSMPLERKSVWAGGGTGSNIATAERSGSKERLEGISRKKNRSISERPAAEPVVLEARNQFNGRPSVDVHVLEAQSKKKYSTDTLV